MKLADLKPGMVFYENLRNPSPDMPTDEFTVEMVGDGANGTRMAFVRGWMDTRNDPHEEGGHSEVAIDDLLNPEKWTFDKLATIARMARHIEILQEKLDGRDRDAREDFQRRRVDMNRVWLYVNEAGAGEYGYFDKEAHLCQQLLEKWGANASPAASSIPPAYPGANHGTSSEAAKKALSDPKLLQAAQEAEKGLKAVAEAMEPGMPPEDEVVSKLDRMTQVLWFMASLTIDHEPLCAIKNADGSACNCDKDVPDGDPWYVRIREALQHPSHIRNYLVQATKLLHLRGEHLVEFERKLTPLAAELDTPQMPMKLVDAVVQRIEQLKTRLERRRVVQLKVREGKLLPGWNGQSYEFVLRDGVTRLITLQGTKVSNEERQALQGKFGPHTMIIWMPEGAELTVLEMPWI